MNLLKIFKSDRDGIKRSHVKDLVSVALADGQLTEDEWQILLYVASRLGISEDEVNFIKNHPETVHFMPPRKYEERIQQIEDLVIFMAIDHNINQKEIELCKKISLNLDVLPQIVDSIIAMECLPEN